MSKRGLNSAEIEQWLTSQGFVPEPQRGVYELARADLIAIVGEDRVTFMVRDLDESTTQVRLYEPDAASMVVGVDNVILTSEALRRVRR